MVDRPRPADPEWLKEVETTFGEYYLVVMTAAGERGIACQMQIEPESLPYPRQYPGGKGAATPLQIIAKRIIIGIDGQTIDHELHSPYAHLRSLVDNFSSVDNECGSDQIRLGVPDHR